MIEIIKVILLGIVEGITEFLPISSTGHLILLERYLQLSGTPGFAETFMVVIQLPAILAVVVYFFPKLWPFRGNTLQYDVCTLWIKIVLAFVPAAMAGVLFDDLLEAWFFNARSVAIALILGGAVLWLIETRKFAPRYAAAPEIPLAAALGVGLFQCIAMMPGVSRSAATIIGAMLLGAGRAAAAEFSFFLAIPTMLGAASFKLLKAGFHFTGFEWFLLGLGGLVSFIVAYLVIAAFMTYIQRRNFIPFAWYRIVLGALILALLLFE